MIEKPMIGKLSRNVAVVAGIAAAGLFGAAVGSAPAASLNPLQIPVVTGPEVGPGGVPGGFLQLVTVTATPGVEAGVTAFEVTSSALYHHQYNYRWITVHWQNLATGAAGTVDLRHWIDNFPGAPDKSYAATLPMQAAAKTGSGPVVATVTHQRDQYEAPPISNVVVPGAGVTIVP